jgi:hypothetical protein
MSDAIKKSIEKKLLLNKAMEECFQEWLDSFSGIESLSNEEMEKEESLDNSFSAGWNYCMAFINEQGKVNGKSIYVITNKIDKK